MRLRLCEVERFALHWTNCVDEYLRLLKRNLQSGSIFQANILAMQLSKQPGFVRNGANAASMRMGKCAVINVAGA